jgi:ABC-type multidrug transport system permease subunit
MHNLPIVCQSFEYNVFNPPSGQTCEAYAASFIQANGGYLGNPSATTACQYCQYRVGDEFYTCAAAGWSHGAATDRLDSPLNLSYDNRWRDRMSSRAVRFLYPDETRSGHLYRLHRYALSEHIHSDRH